MGIYSRETKILIWKDSCTPMFIAELLTIAKTWKQSNCPSLGEWIKMSVYICVFIYIYIYIYIYICTHTMEYYLAIKMRKSNHFWHMDKPWRHCASEVNQIEKNKYCPISVACGIKKKKANQSHRERDQTCGYQRQNVWGSRDGRKWSKGTNFQLQDK